MLTDVVVFGASGDLTARLLLPALAELEAASLLGGDLRIRGADRPDWSDDRFRRYASEALDSHASDVPDDAREALLGRLSYRQVDVTDPATVAAALDGLDRPLAAHLALPPALFEPALSALADATLPDGSTVVIEKPFGQDLASARHLNRLLRERFGDIHVFRNDHFLHNQTVQNVLGLRFANRLFEPTWNADNVQRVDIVWDETLTVGSRAGYYDRSGALRDMLQNHLLQVLCFVAMEPPASLEAADLRSAMLAVLRAVATPDDVDVADHTARGRYVAGAIDGRSVEAYTDADGVDPARHTETFAQVTLQVDNWRWAGVPFTLRSGKALPAARAEVVVTLRDVPHPTFAAPDGARPNTVRIGLKPPRVVAQLNVNASGELFGLVPLSLDADLPAPTLSPYAGLVRDVLVGDRTLSVSAAESEEAWRIMDPILDGWAADGAPLREYAAGSDTPDGWTTT